jgi:hypothetical protein
MILTMIILLFTMIYIKFGLFTLIQIMIWSIVLLTSNILIGINPNSKELHVIRFTSILVIMFIFYINYKGNNTLLAFVIPFIKGWHFH